jgi:hypothetical protein
VHCNYRYLRVALASTTTLLSLQVFAPVYSQSPLQTRLSLSAPSAPFEITLDYKPPIERNPRRTRGSGTRGSCPGSDAWLRLLVPTGNFAESTVSGYPVFSWYLTEPTSVPLEFALIEEGGSEFLYETRLTESTAGINQLQLPDSAPELVPGKIYEWSVTLICDEFDHSQNISYYDWVKRVPPSETLAQPDAPQPSPSQNDYPDIPAEASNRDELSTPWRLSSQRQQVIQFAQNGQWYDALAELLEAYAADPDNALIKEDLVSLLEQGGLADVVERLD